METQRTFKVRTGQRAPSTGIASSSTGKLFKESTRKTDWRHSIIELDRLRQFDQHYVASDQSSWSIEFLVDDDTAGRNAKSVLIRLRNTMLSNDHDGLVESKSRLKATQQRQNYL